VLDGIDDHICLGAVPIFQKEYETKAFTHCYDIAPLPDGGFLLSGIQDVPTFSAPGTPYITKVDCTGEPEWTKRFEAVSGLNNTDHEVAVISEDEYVLLSSRGSTGNFDILVAKLDAEGIRSGVLIMADPMKTYREE
jgi:hypothetical protein